MNNKKVSYAEMSIEVLEKDIAEKYGTQHTFGCDQVHALMQDMGAGGVVKLVTKGNPKLPTFASSSGTIFSLNSRTGTIEEVPQGNPVKIPHPHAEIGTNNYVRVGIKGTMRRGRRKGKIGTTSMHVPMLMAETFGGVVSSKAISKYFKHLNDNPEDCSLENIMWSPPDRRARFNGALALEEAKIEVERKYKEIKSGESRSKQYRPVSPSENNNEPKEQTSDDHSKLILRLTVAIAKYENGEMSAGHLTAIVREIPIEDLKFMPKDIMEKLESISYQ